MIDNLRTFPPLCLLALLCLAGIFAWFTRRVIFAQIWYDLRLCYHEGGWDGVREFLQTGMIPWPKK